jgi:hypothetical protein
MSRLSHRLQKVYCKILHRYTTTTTITTAVVIEVDGVPGVEVMEVAIMTRHS